MTQGSLVGIDNSTTPITTAVNVYQELTTMYSTTNMNNLGLTMPIALNYKSYSLYRSCGENHDLVLPHSRQFYEKYKDKVLQGINEIPLDNIITDTIGVIEIKDDYSKIATSSGGNFFKVPGRIGCAGEIGGAVDYRRQNEMEISCVCSGNGEDILQMKLARFVVEHFDPDVEQYGQHLVEMIQQHGTKFNLLAKGKFDDKAIVYVGVIVIVNDRQRGIKRLIYCHSTESFYFGFRAWEQLEPNTVLSRLDNPSKVGNVFAYGEFKV
jgi:taspase (threonine aspartase 1)